MKWWQVPSNKWLKGYWSFNAFLLLTSIFLFIVVTIPDWVVFPIAQVRQELRHQDPPPSPPDTPSQILSAMDPSSIVGQLFSVSIDLDQATRSADLISQIKPGFIGIFNQSDLPPSEIHRQIQTWHQIASASAIPAPIVMIDHEGGRVQRFTQGLTLLPSWEELCRHSTPEEIQQLAQQVSQELSSIGIDGVWGPVVDRSNPQSQILSTRTCSGRTDQINLLSSAYISGLQQNHTLSVIKHYPGLGGTNTDPHLSLGQVDNIDTSIYSSLLPLADGVMVTHVALSDDKLPCTISGRCLTWLKQNLPPDKSVLIWSDAMEMQGITQTVAPSEAAHQAILAGIDVLLYGASAPPSVQEEVHHSLLQAYQNDPVFAQLVDQRVLKILQLKLSR